MFVNHFYNCLSCKAINKISIDADDRGQLQMKKGEEIGFTCNSCYKKEKIHINKIYAELSKIVYISALVLSALLFAYFWNSGTLVKIICSLPMIIYLYQQSLARNFNKYRIKNKI